MPAYELSIGCRPITTFLPAAGGTVRLGTMSGKAA